MVDGHPQAEAHRRSGICRSRPARRGADRGGTRAEIRRNYSEPQYDAADRLTGRGRIRCARPDRLPSRFLGGGTLETSYYVNDLTHSQTQDGITNTYELDAALRQRKRVRTKGEEESTEIYHYANRSDSPAWIDEGEGQWSRFIEGIGASAIEKSATEDVVFQLSDMHGDIVATADDSIEATELLSTQQFDEYGNPKQKLGLDLKLGWLGSKMRRTELPSGVIQMGVRSYVPAMGRFLSPDPVLGGSANAYEYAGGDPVNNFDLTGERCRSKRRCAKALRRAKRRARRSIRRVRALVRKKKRARNRSLALVPSLPRLPWEDEVNDVLKKASNTLMKIDEATTCELGTVAAGAGSQYVRNRGNKLATQVPKIANGLNRLSSRLGTLGIALSVAAIFGVC